MTKLRFDRQRNLRQIRPLQSPPPPHPPLLTHPSSRLPRLCSPADPSGLRQERGGKHIFDNPAHGLDKLQPPTRGTVQTYTLADADGTAAERLLVQAPAQADADALTYARARPPVATKPCKWLEVHAESLAKEEIAGGLPATGLMPPAAAGIAPSEEGADAAAAPNAAEAAVGGGGGGGEAEEAAKVPIEAIGSRKQAAAGGAGEKVDRRAELKARRAKLEAAKEEMRAAKELRAAVVLIRFQARLRGRLARKKAAANGVGGGKQEAAPPVEVEKAAAGVDNGEAEAEAVEEKPAE